MRKAANVITIFWWKFCKKIYVIKSFFIYIIDVIHKKAEWKITILHWLLNSECNYNLKLISDFFNSKNAELIFENTIFYKIWYHCCLQSNSYMWEWWEVYCILNTMKIV